MYYLCANRRNCPLLSRYIGISIVSVYQHWGGREGDKRIDTEHWEQTDIGGLCFICIITISLVHVLLTINEWAAGLFSLVGGIGGIDGGWLSGSHSCSSGGTVKLLLIKKGIVLSDCLSQCSAAQIISIWGQPIDWIATSVFFFFLL